MGFGGFLGATPVAVLQQQQAMVTTPPPAPTVAPTVAADQVTALSLQVSDLTKVVQRLSSSVGQTNAAAKRERELTALEAKLKNPELECEKCEGKGHTKLNCVPPEKATLKGGKRCMRCNGLRHIDAVCTSPLK